MNERKQQLTSCALAQFRSTWMTYLSTSPFVQTIFQESKKCRTHFKTINVKLANKADQLFLHIRVQIASEAQNSKPSRRLTSRMSFSHKPLSSEIRQRKSCNPRDRMCVTSRVSFLISCSIGV